MTDTIQTKPAVSLDELERSAVESMGLGGSRPPDSTPSPSPSSTPAARQQAAQDKAPADDSAPEPPASKAKPPEKDKAPESKSKTDPAPKPAEGDKGKPSVDDGKSESDYQRELKDFRRRVPAWNKINEAREQLQTWEQQKTREYADREARIAQFERTMGSQIEAARAGKLPDYKAGDGRMYPADALLGVMADAAADGDQQKFSEAAQAWAGLHRQSAAQAAFTPSPEQYAQTKQQIDLAIAKRPELAHDSGSVQSEVLKVFFNDPEFRDFIARRKSGVVDVIGLADAIALGRHAGPMLKERDDKIAELQAKVEELGGQVADYESKSAPTRASAVRTKPTTTEEKQKAPSSLSTEELERTVRDQERAGVIRWG